ncbi:OprD family porin [Metapseudomonas resinovorans]|uniref:Putative porin n=1 Tax=Metapseudomonas resinovorans NBRC 106553 TaxID=1245471 RepID=S6AKR2_METRE|nr:OprD family porin [Pseudomonas resinovorans]BAN49255.1 putative porin [Pseudomonas resinovorans NBRC 106553]
MNTNAKPLPSTLACLVACLTPAAGAAGFIEDSKANLQLRNIYFNDDFKDETGMSAKSAANAQSKKEEWAQGFLLDVQSGYTPGRLGFGLDALGLLGMKLDSGAGRAGTGLLPVHDDGRAADEFSSLGLTAKARFAGTTLKHGTHQPKLPVLVRNDARLLPQTFEGTQVTSTDIADLSLTGGYFDEFRQRDSSDNHSITADGYAGDDGEGFWFAGADYKPSKVLTLSYYYGELEEFYQQHFIGLVHSLPLGPGSLTTDLRYFHSQDAGEARNGELDNDMYSGLLTYNLKGHALSAGYQQLNGEGGLPFVNGATVYSFSNAGVGKFVEEDEKTWMLGYAYDFAAIGVPGLTAGVRYFKGRDGTTELRGSEVNADEWERDIDLAYVVQQGALKGLGVKLRNIAYRSSYSRGRDNNRLYFTYDIALW